MEGVRPRLVPGVPWLSAFGEINVRTYVRGQVLTEDGCLIASFTQDAMIRAFEPARTSSESGRF